MWQSSITQFVTKLEYRLNQKPQISSKLKKNQFLVKCNFWQLKTSQHLIGCQCAKLFLLKCFTITTIKFGHNFIFWVWSQFLRKRKKKRDKKVRDLFCHFRHYCHNFSFLFSFVTIWVFEFSLQPCSPGPCSLPVSPGPGSLPAFLIMYAMAPTGLQGGGGEPARWVFNGVSILRWVSQLFQYWDEFLRCFSSIFKGSAVCRRLDLSTDMGGRYTGRVW